LQKEKVFYVVGSRIKCYNYSSRAHCAAACCLILLFSYSRSFNRHANELGCSYIHTYKMYVHHGVHECDLYTYTLALSLVTRFVMWETSPLVAPSKCQNIIHTKRINSLMAILNSEHTRKIYNFIPTVMRTIWCLLICE
jgi:hypothetical protein